MPASTFSTSTSESSDFAHHHLFLTINTPKMCHFIWQDNPCSECGILFDRKLTCCQSERMIIKTRCSRSTSRGQEPDESGEPCDTEYAMLIDPTFKCQACKVIELEPWVPVQQLEDLERPKTEEGGGGHAGDEDYVEWEDKNDTDWVPDSDDED
jgi:hypothetical protein